MSNFAGGNGGGSIPHDYDDLDSDRASFSINKFNPNPPHDDAEYVDRVRVSLRNSDDDPWELSVAFAVPADEDVEFDLPDDAEATTEAPQSVVARADESTGEFDAQGILDRQTEFDFYSFAFTVDAQTEAPDDLEDSYVDGHASASVTVPSPKGISKEYGCWILGSFAGGSGTSSDPYLIEDWNHLDEVRNNLDDSFELIADLDQTTNGYDDHASETANEGDGWEPIGDEAGTSGLDGLTGTFDGKDHSISDFYIDRTGRPIGLFGVIDKGILKNITLDGDITGEDDVAIACGLIRGSASSDEGLIDSCIVFGSVSGDSNVGGIVGIAEGNPDNTWTQNIIRSGNLANVSGDANVGGVVGYNEFADTCFIQSCFSAGTISGDIEDVGGIMGGEGEEIRDSYAIGTIAASGADKVGGGFGIVGNESGNQIERTYTAADVSGGNNVGGFIGEADHGSFTDVDIVDSYHDIELSGEDAVGAGDQSSIDITDYSTSEMQGSSAETNMTGLDWTHFETVEASDEDASNDGYPILQEIDREIQLEAQGILGPGPPTNLTLTQTG